MICGICILIISIINALFGFIWLAVGGKLLYDRNKNCISNAFVHIFYAFTLWIICAFNPFEKNKNDEYENL
jgi:hypothetical protein